MAEKKTNPAFSGAYANIGKGISPVTNLNAGGGEENIDIITNSEKLQQQQTGSFIDEVADQTQSTDSHPNWNRELKQRIAAAPNEVRQVRLEQKLANREQRQHDRAMRISGEETRLGQKIEKTLAPYLNSYEAVNESAANLAKEGLMKEISGNQSLNQLPRTKIEE